MHSFKSCFNVFRNKLFVFPQSTRNFQDFLYAPVYFNGKRNRKYFSIKTAFDVDTKSIRNTK